MALGGGGDNDDDAQGGGSPPLPFQIRPEEGGGVHPICFIDSFIGIKALNGSVVLAAAECFLISQKQTIVPME
uniref:Uncharacterized protein n=1 Tax=Oryza sativa subsp. japonica TaxID=39947 RepID=Q6K2K0_ORYSJ|nr:hypothetical protein [Oryza sativa Japonica Group]